MTKKHIVLAGGGTGGHFFCMQAIAQQILSCYKEHNFSITFITDTRCIKFIKSHPICAVELRGIRYFIIKSTMLSRSFVKLLGVFCVICYETLRILRLFIFNRPKVVVGFGGYASFCPLLAAFFLKIPIMLHEQNLITGTVNRIFAKFAQKVSFGLGIDAKLQIDKKKVVLVKPITRSAILCHEVVSQYSSNNNFSIFILGGSAGANIFASLLIQTLSILKKKVDISNISIFQQCLASDIAYVQNCYSNLGLKSFVVKDFFQDVGFFFNKADVVIARAGSGTICEILSTKNASILIPLPSAALNHQFYNAKYLYEQNMCWLVQQHVNLEATVLSLSTLLNDILSNRDLLMQKKRAIDALMGNSNLFDLHQVIVKNLVLCDK